MEINSSLNNGLLTVTPIGRLDSTTSGELDEKLKNDITDDVNSLVIDMAQVDYISSKGLRVLVTAYRTLAGRSMQLINLNNSVTEVLRLSGMLKFFQVK